MCRCVCVYELALRPGAHIISCGLKSLGGDEIETQQAQKKLPPGIISMIGDGLGLYMSGNNPKPESRICLDALQQKLQHCFPGF